MKEKTAVVPADIRQRFSTGSKGQQPEDRLFFREGSRADYRQLSRFHYKSGEPATMLRVLTLRSRGQSVVGRYLGRRGENVLASVLVISLPAPSCSLRDLATGGRYRGFSPRESMALLNREVRTISRVVVDPQWRGLGLAVKLVREAMATVRQPYVEALAAMGRVNPFFERAGMKRYDRPPRREYQRLLDVLSALEIEPWETASPARIITRLRDDEKSLRFLHSELKRWARSAPRRKRKQGDSKGETLNGLLQKAREHLLCQPVYYLYRTNCTREAEGKEVLSLEPENKDHRSAAEETAGTSIEQQCRTRGDAGET